MASGDDATEVIRLFYQTRVDSDDDCEFVVLNLVRRPSGILTRGFGDGREGE